MADLTSTEIGTRALEEMGVLGSHKTETSDMTADMAQAYAESYAELEERQLTTWASTASVPEAYCQAVIGMIAVRRATRWGAPDGAYQRLVLRWGVDGEKAVDKIEQIRAKAWSGEIVPAQHPF